MIIDDQTIVLCIVLLVLAVASSLANPFFRFKTQVQEPVSDDSIPAKGPAVTVLITVHENAHELDKHLPILLSQVYEPGYEVVVVAEKGDAEAENVLKRYGHHPHLYTTFIPDSSKYMSRKKLAITLGVKAAKNEWILLTEPFSAPQSEEWLQSMATHCAEDKNLVIGYSGYSPDSKAFQRFERLQTACYLMNKDRKSVSYRTNGTNLMFRKSEFMEHQGYQGNLHLLRGEFDFLVNKYAHQGGTALALSPLSWVRDDAPSGKSWKNKHLFYLETRKYLKRSFPVRFAFNIDQWMLHLNFIALIAAFAFSILTQSWILCGCAAVATAITLTLRIMFAKRMINHFSEEIPGWKILPYELSMASRNLVHFIQYKLADKNDFTSHKL
ncbi:MAG: group 2 glycosyl transferase [Prevotella sp.]|nr:group 2 glycosyl transferase [Prevotella sp.]